MKLILATTSKFKSSIMDKVGLKHSMIESNFDEKSVKEENIYKYVKELSKGKAISIIDKVDSGFIIGLDTVVYVNKTILEKPKDLVQAKEFIRMCRNNTASVITGICIIDKTTNNIINDCSETLVTLRNIDELDIDYYIENEKDALYVSGFVIESIMSNFIEKIEGSYYNMLGIPVETIYKHINELGYHLKDLQS